LSYTMVVMDEAKPLIRHLEYPAFDATDGGAGLQRINEAVCALARAEGCLPIGYSAAETADWDVTWSVKVQYVHRDLLALRISVDEMCGGPHPDISFDVLYFDRQTGERLPGLAVSDRKLGALAARYLHDVVRSLAEPDCHIITTADLTDFHVVPTAGGVEFSPLLPQVIQACGEPLILPWADAQPYLRAGTTLQMAKP
jgi:hypothetical protein